MKISFVAWTSIFDLKNPLFKGFNTFTRELHFACFLLILELMMNLFICYAGMDDMVFGKGN